MLALVPYKGYEFGFGLVYLYKIKVISKNIVAKTASSEVAEKKFYILYITIYKCFTNRFESFTRLFYFQTFKKRILE